MNVIDSAAATVRDYKGGSESLAPRLGMTAAVLRNKVNPNNDRNVLGLAEAQALMQVTGDHRVLQAQASDLGYALVRLDDEDIEQRGGSVIGMVLQLDAAGGNFSQVLRDAMADDVITKNEMKAIDKYAHAEQGALIGLVKLLREFSMRGRVE